LLVQVLLLSQSCSAAKTNDDANPLSRLLMNRFASSTMSTKMGFLRKLANDNGDAMKREFGPGADWSCTGAANDAFHLDSCTLGEVSAKTKDDGGCFWCPLGTENGICVSAAQAELINGFGNDHLLHVKCVDQNYGTKEKDEETTQADIGHEQFWNEVFSCLPHSRDSCGGDHTLGDHACTYCTVKDPAMGLCLSNNLWESLTVAQALEDFDRNVSPNSQIRLDQVVHCDASIEEAHNKNSAHHDDSLWSDVCGGAEIDSKETEEECLGKSGCAIAPNVLPGFLGSVPGNHCVTIAQERSRSWLVQLLRDMGWTDEMYTY